MNEKKAPKDEPLFGPEDQLVNTLECELTWVRGEIKRCERAIERSEADVVIFESRVDNLEEALRFARRRKGKDAEPAPEAKPAAAAPAAKPAAADKPAVAHHYPGEVSGKGRKRAQDEPGQTTPGGGG